MIVLGLRYAFFGYSFLIFSFFIIPAFGEEKYETSPLVLVETDKPEYKIGDSVTISGVVEEKKMPVLALRIFNPDGKILTANNVEIGENNTFSKSIFQEKAGTEKIHKIPGQQILCQASVESSAYWQGLCDRGHGKFCFTGRLG